MAKPSNWEAHIGRRVRLYDLHAFAAVIRAGSISKAAAELGVTQSAVSQMTADLEAAWESNFRSAAHAPVRGLPIEDQDLFRSRYEATLKRALVEDERGVTRGDVLFAFGRK